MGNGLSDHDVLSLAVGVFFQIPELYEIKGNGKRQDGVDSRLVAERCSNDRPFGEKPNDRLVSRDLVDRGLFGGEFFGVQAVPHELLGPGE